MTNAERAKHQFTDDDRCPLCADSVEDIDHVMRKCSAIFPIWILLIKEDKLDEFMSMEMKTWIRINLDNKKYFAKVSEEWDILFGSILWNTWKKRNSIVFDSPLENSSSLLERSRRLQTITFTALEQEDARKKG
ncbi:hypothetical protein F3Y22_tig00112738pilonHSYRG01145 [Hibiscus syriacus]|uniref:Reverse transcriptase zinc-binding domain-containing protein n=1 Tax=Hibiscus syriacus TaxID=106335 RepID=A0A6A2WUR3_HIBSY|nr:hypothetical protein F3Y22_tig00112738pilonHSYRG01145 [Hibiscus syriacus]